MREYLVIAPTGVNFPTGGKLKLTKEQHMSRVHNLKAVEGRTAVFEILKPVQFKNGEKVFFDGDVSKQMLQDIGEVVKTGSTGSPSADLNDLTKAELKDKLDKKEIPYTGRENKATLIGMVQNFDAKV